MEVIDSSLNGPPGDPIGLTLLTDEKVNVFLREILEELDKGKPTAERFAYLCYCMILKCIGEEVEVSPLEVFEEVQPGKDATGDKRYEASPNEQKILSELEGTQRMDCWGEIQKLLAATEALTPTSSSFCQKRL